MSEAKNEERLKSFKKTVDQDDGRRRREETQLSLRKLKKDERLAKRRFASRTDSVEEVTAVPDAAEHGKKTPTVGDLPKLVAVIKEGKGPADPLIEATRTIRRMLSVSHNPPVKEVVDAGALPHLVELLMRTDSFALQFEASWALTNIASTNYTSTVADQPNAVQYLINLLRSPNDDVREQCAWCLGNIAGDGPEFRDGILRLGVIDSLLMNIKQPANDSLLGNVTWTLSNLCRGKPQPSLTLVEPAIPALIYLACNSTVDDITADALWALSYIADGNDERIDAILRADTDGALMTTVVKYVSCSNPQLISPSLRILGNFVSGTEKQTQAVIDAGALDSAMTTLECSKKSLRKEMCWLLSNIAAGTQAQITSLIKTNGVAERLVSLAIDAEWETRKESIWAVSNIFTGGSDNHVAFLVNQGGIAAMASVLEIPGETRMALVALEALDNIFTVSERQGYSFPVLFDECGGLDKLEELQSHSDTKVYEKAIEMIDRFFGEDEAEDENLAPGCNGDSFAFGMSSPPPAKNLFDTPENPVFSFGSANNFNFGG